MAEVLVVQSKVKDYIKSKGLMSGGDVGATASAALAKIIDAAIARAQANGRKTLRDYDF